MSGEAVSGCLSREAVSVQGGRVCLPRETLFVSLSVQGGHVCLSAQGGRVCLSMEAVSVFVQGGRVYLLVQGGCVYQERPYLFREAVSACPGRPCLSVCLSKEAVSVPRGRGGCAWCRRCHGRCVSLVARRMTFPRLGCRRVAYRHDMLCTECRQCVWALNADNACGH